SFEVARFRQGNGTALSAAERAAQPRINFGFVEELEKFGSVFFSQMMVRDNVPYSRFTFHQRGPSGLGELNGFLELKFNVFLSAHAMQLYDRVTTVDAVGNTESGEKDGLNSFPATKILSF